MAIPPTAGTARFENDIATWSSVVDQGGSLVCTVPCRATAHPTLQASERTRAQARHRHPPPASARHADGAGRAVAAGGGPRPGARPRGGEPGARGAGGCEHGVLGVEAAVHDPRLVQALDLAPDLGELVVVHHVGVDVAQECADLTLDEN